jgi:hypothetical protein
VSQGSINHGQRWSLRVHSDQGIVGTQWETFLDHLIPRLGGEKENKKTKKGKRERNKKVDFYTFSHFDPSLRSPDITLRWQLETQEKGK